MQARDKTNIVKRLEGLVRDCAPGASLRSMYGGTVIELEKGNPKSRIGGFYVYDAHVSFEFAKGHALHDPDGFLEGSGKMRRHIKLRGLADVETKKCQTFLEQTLAAQ